MQYNARILRVFKVDPALRTLKARPCSGRHESVEGVLPRCERVDGDFVRGTWRARGVGEVGHGRQMGRLKLGGSGGRELAEEGFFDLLQREKAHLELEMLL